MVNMFVDMARISELNTVKNETRIEKTRSYIYLFCPSHGAIKCSEHKDGNKSN